MVGNVGRAGGINAMNILPPKEYEKYEYEVNIDGKKQLASVEITPTSKVTIHVDDGKTVKTIKTDKKGLLAFNQKYMPKQKLYSSKPDKSEKDDEKDFSIYSRIMQNLALANLFLAGRRYQNTLHQNMDEHNRQIAQQMHDMANQAHMTAVQMTTPGMGII